MICFGAVWCWILGLAVYKLPTVHGKGNIWSSVIHFSSKFISLFLFLLRLSLIVPDGCVLSHSLLGCVSPLIVPKGCVLSLPLDSVLSLNVPFCRRSLSFPFIGCASDLGCVPPSDSPSPGGSGAMLITSGGGSSLVRDRNRKFREVSTQRLSVSPVFIWIWL